MKHSLFKKLCATASVSAMAFAFMPAGILAVDDTPTVLAAADDTTYGITLNNAVPNGTYNLYQLFTGTFASTDSVQMGDAVINPALKTIIVNAIKTYLPDFALDTTRSEADQANQITGAIADIQAGANGDVQLQRFANDVANAIAADTTLTPMMTETASADGTATFADLPTGYYLVMSANNDGYDAGNGAYTRAIILPVNDNKTVDVKTTNVTNLNKYANVNGTEQKYADVSIKDGKVIVPEYGIKADVSGLYQYTNYPLNVIDTLPQGLTTTADEVSKDWNLKVEATLGSGDTAVTKDITASFTTAVDAPTQNQSTVTFAAANLIEALQTGGFTDEQINGFDSVFTINVTYTPVYDATDIEALFSAPSALDAPQINSAYITFPENPYDKGEDPTPVKTPTSEVKTYSYNLKVNKIGPDGNALTGANFTLSTDGTSAGKDVTAADDGTFTFTGLAAGQTYTLTETAVPAGMQQIDPITFTITENPNDPKDAIVTIEGAIGEDPDKAAVLTVDDASIVLTVTNVAGHAMPTTGMAGMTLLTGAGVVLAGSLYALTRGKKKAE